MGAELAARMDRLGRIFLIIDQSQAGALPPESRRFLADWNLQHTLGGVAVFGGSISARVISTLLQNAYRLLRPNGVPMVFAANELEARAWVATQRIRTWPSTRNR